jgi:hypothetical protein
MTGAVDLSGLNTLNRLPPELKRLTSLQSLDLLGCDQLSDLSPRAKLPSLDLSGCYQLGDLSPLNGLTFLRSLHLRGCLGFRRFASVESLLPTLAELVLWGCKFDDLPIEVCGESTGENVLDKVRAHLEDLRSGPKTGGRKVRHLARPTRLYKALASGVRGDGASLQGSRGVRLPSLQGDARMALPDRQTGMDVLDQSALRRGVLFWKNSFLENSHGRRQSTLQRARINLQRFPDATHSFGLEAMNHHRN